MHIIPMNHFHPVRQTGLLIALWLSFRLIEGADAAAFTPGNPLSTGRDWHTATLLLDGKVLVTGGTPDRDPDPSSSFLASTERFDPATGTWTLADPMTSPHASHTATLLPDGRVLVAGTPYGRPDTATAELYDPGTGRWAATGPMITPRFNHSATLLPDGTVLVAGGGDSSMQPLASTEIFDPAAGTWRSSGSLNLARGVHTATLLPNGRVLVTGGYGAGSTTEVFDPVTRTWTLTAPMATARYYHTATLLVDGTVLVVAGANDDGYQATAERYQPATGKWLSAGTLAHVRMGHSANLLPDGRVLVAGGDCDTCPSTADHETLSSAEIFDPATGSWAPTSSMGTAREWHTGTMLPDGRLLITGGARGNDIRSLSSSELYGPVIGTHPTPRLALHGRPGDGSCQFKFTNTIGALFTARAATNIAAPLGSWTMLGVAFEHPPGQFQCTGLDVRVDRQRFYVVTDVFAPAGSGAPPGMVLIPAGSFQMGTSFDEGESDERPVHAVAVSAFFMDRTEVTKGLWDEVRAWALGHGYGFDSRGEGKEANHPVHRVSWWDVVKWCNARSEKEGRVPAYYKDGGQTTVYRTGQVDIENGWVRWGSGYRLPTEAEWEYAARGGSSGNRFPWGNTITHSQANYRTSTSYSYDVSPTQGFHPTYATGGYPYTSPVGVFLPNGYGLYDMAGNLWEWCWDWHAESYYGSSPGEDPRGVASGTYRVFRGGCWYYDSYDCRSANRNFANPSYTDYGGGFRTVLPPNPR